MAIPNTKNELKAWILKKLGDPVIRVDVTNDQIEQCLDETIEHWQQFHFDGTEKIYLKHKITASVLSFSAPFTGTFNKSEQVKGQVSGAVATVFSVASLSSIEIKVISDVGFIAGEPVLSDSGGSGTVASTNFFVPGDVGNRFITLPRNVQAVVGILVNKDAYSQFTSTNSTDSLLFNLEHQILIQSLPEMANFDLSTFVMYKQRLSLLQHILHGESPYEFNKRTGRCYLNVNWSNDVTIGKYVVFETLQYVVPDPANSPVWGDEWVRSYAIAKLKKQWGQNLSKHQNIQLPGGVTLNADRLLDDSQKDIEMLEERLRSELQLTVPFMMG
jgi:hypothetical protein